MHKRHLLTLCLVLAATPSTAQEMLLYAPQSTGAVQAPADPSEGVLVKTVTIKRGDTLKKISRKHIGVSSWFPQVLLFNNIKNPDLIHPGDRLLVPVPAGKAAAAERRPAKKAKSIRTAVKAKKAAAPIPQKAQTAPQPAQAGEQEIFQKAKRAYLAKEYQQALELFSNFLRDFPQSRFAADAALYRADCYLRLSRE